jgi:hypothetical protein
MVRQHAFYLRKQRRRHVIAYSVQLIGKKANKWEEFELAERAIAGATFGTLVASSLTTT